MIDSTLPGWMMAWMETRPEPPADTDTSTTVGDGDLERAIRSRWARRSVLGLLLLFVILGAAGVFGARTHTVSASGEGYELAVTYPAVTRPGLAIRWSVEVRREGGLGQEVVIATSAAYFDLFDFNQFYPQPSEETSDGHSTIWTFQAPEGDVMQITMDGRMEPAQQSGAGAITSVLLDGRPAVEVRYSTVVMP
jgi:hypothetical protein